MQTAIEMPPHRQPCFLSPPHHPLSRLRPCLPTSSPMAAAITLWSVITFPAGTRFLNLQQAQPSQVLLASFATSIPSSPCLVYRKNFPVMVAQNSLQDVQRLSSVSREYDILCPWHTSISPMAEQRWQSSQPSAFLCLTPAQLAA